MRQEGEAWDIPLVTELVTELRVSAMANVVMIDDEVCSCAAVCSLRQQEHVLLGG